MLDFETHSRNSTAKTPLDAFEEDKIENDIVPVLKVLEKYKTNYCYEKLEFGGYTMKVFLPHANRDFYLASRCSI